MRQARQVIRDFSSVSPGLVKMYPTRAWYSPPRLWKLNTSSTVPHAVLATEPVLEAGAGPPALSNGQELRTTTGCWPGNSRACPMERLYNPSSHPGSNLLQREVCPALTPND